MEKTLYIDGQPIKIKSTAGTSRRYRNQFGNDFFGDMLKLYPLMQLKDKGIDTNNLDYETLQHLDFEVFENFVWALAKTADKTIADPDEWYDQFATFPVADILPEIQEFIGASLESSKKK